MIDFKYWEKVLQSKYPEKYNYLLSLSATGCVVEGRESYIEEVRKTTRAIESIVFYLEDMDSIVGSTKTKRRGYRFKFIKELEARGIAVYKSIDKISTREVGNYFHHIKRLKIIEAFYDMPNIVDIEKFKEWSKKYGY